MPAQNAPATNEWTSPAYPAGDVLMLLDDLADIRQGLYLVHAVRDGWATLWAPSSHRLLSAPSGPMPVRSKRSTGLSAQKA
jgi:hypothetical protein